MKGKVAFVLALAVLSGCGVAPQPQATRLPDVSSPEPPVATRRPPEPISLHVWLVRDSRLVAVERDAPSPSVGAALVALSQGPTADELAAGLRSALPAAAKVTLLGSPPGVAVLELGEDVTAITGQEQVLAIAQLVLTATELPSVTSVEFVVSGQQVDVPLSDGTLSTGTVRRSDYATLIG